ncbi:unnamed protein product, partial [Natator depressus]
QLLWGMGGLCGNFNQNRGDDMTSPNGTRVSSIVEWARSWKVKDRDPFCWDDAKGHAQRAMRASRRSTGRRILCMISKKPGGPFRECHSKVSPKDIFDSCIYDVCLNGGAKNILCQALEAYAAICKKQGITVYDWRTPSGCPLRACGNACPASCSDHTANSSCQEPCVETWRLQRLCAECGQCVPVESCGCDYNGRYYKPTRSSGPMRTAALGADVIPAWLLHLHGLRRPHYTTFDGKSTISCAPASTSWLGSALWTPRSPHSTSRWRITTAAARPCPTPKRDLGGLRGEATGLRERSPSPHQDRLCAEGDLRGSLVRVTVPNTYANALCGLCGDNNQTASDDLTMRDGRRAANAVQFAESWKVGEVPGCSDSCTGKCLVCSEAQRQPYKGDRYCGVISRGDGPFRECHGVIDPAPFFDDCVFDTCQYKGLRDALCSAISAYVTACQARGIRIGQWRSASFCSPTCPSNFHYELCGSGCPATCHGLSAPDGCDAPCAEGCFCDAGFLLSGDRCVPIAQCGCVHQGTYYRKGEVFYSSASCWEQCRCQDNGVVQCREASCGANEQCKVADGVRKCHPVGSATCSAAGDPHYLSFDGVAFDFQGTCTYILAKTCADAGNLTSFSVKVENKPWGNGKVSVTKLVSVEVYGLTLTLLQNRKGLVM